MGGWYDPANKEGNDQQRGQVSDCVTASSERKGEPSLLSKETKLTSLNPVSSGLNGHVITWRGRLSAHVPSRPPSLGLLSQPVLFGLPVLVVWTRIVVLGLILTVRISATVRAVCAGHTRGIGGLGLFDRRSTGRRSVLFVVAVRAGVLGVVVVPRVGVVVVVRESFLVVVLGVLLPGRHDSPGDGDGKQLLVNI